ncbi:hypothetical protein [Arthrobacter sp. S39]|uniref:hypothetical protein n=1 Tax=Arthrobacter sp. S39 TaxID=2509720 RepID=UPI0010377783|nr:hypothetical protein [Arthrobacter sp. S39]TAP43169.1 hypothetical protein EYS21_13490 [Arthrobacter sp. S39]
MDAATTGLLGGLAGVLLGGFLTYVLDRRNAVSMRLHESRIEAYKLFASCAMDYRRAVMDQWFEDHRLQNLTEDDDVHRARSAAWSAYYGVRLVTGNPQLGTMGRNILDRITELKDVEHREELNRLGEACRDEVDGFVEKARRDVVATRSV